MSTRVKQFDSFVWKDIYGTITLLKQDQCFQEGNDMSIMATKHPSLLELHDLIPKPNDDTIILT